MPSDRINDLILNKKEPEPSESGLSMSGVDPALDSLPEAPPAPPPIQPPKHVHDPYDFITNPAAPAKKKLLPSANSKTGRLVLVGVGAVVFIFVAIIIFGLIRSSGSGLKTDYLSLAQQQTELIRISGVGLTKAGQAETKNLAITTKDSITSQQPAILALAKKAGAKTDVKTLALGKDAATDALLTNADQANQFDSVFVKTLQTKLKTYQALLKKVYDASSKATTKTTLAKDYSDVAQLVGNQANPVQ